nr:hypothetical protein [Terriglobia bacterium]
VRFGVALRTAVLYTRAMTGIAIQILLRMRMRQEILHRFAMADFAEVSGFLVSHDGCTDEEKR